MARLGKTAEELVQDFGDPQRRFAAFQALNDLGQEALPAIRHGLLSDDSQTRKWSAMFLDHHADDEALQSLIPLLNDPNNEVRLWATHSISCDTRASPAAIPLMLCPS